MRNGFFGRHYETGTLANALHAMDATNPRTGKPYSEALALGASGGIAFGHFVFAYTGQLPHAAILTRNTFGPFEQALDNLAIRRDSRETTDAARAERNLIAELDCGNPVIVWADVFSLPYNGLRARDQVWAMRPLLVVGQEGRDFLVVDGPAEPFPVPAVILSQARGRVKKDRFRMQVLEKPDESLVAEGLRRGIDTCAALFLDKPPAGSPNNFGVEGMRHWAKLLTDDKNPKSWAKMFEPGPNLVQALAGAIGQPGVWDWIETWGTAGGADRETYAAFLEEASVWIGNGDLARPAANLTESASLWRRLADAAMPDQVPEFKRLKSLKQRHVAVWRELGLASLGERAAIREEVRSLIEAATESAVLKSMAAEIRQQMAGIVLQIADLEESAIRGLRS